MMTWINAAAMAGAGGLALYAAWHAAVVYQAVGGILNTAAIRVTHREPDGSMREVTGEELEMVRAHRAQHEARKALALMLGALLAAVAFGFMLGRGF